MIGVGRRKKDPAAHPAYLSHFRLREAPFANGDARYFYADPERTQTLNMLLHLAQYSEELLVVTGPEGSGKSKLLDQFLARADEGWKVCRVGPDSAGDAGALFLHIARCFGLDPAQHPGDQLLEALRSHLEAMQTRELPVLVVDDAEALSDDALEIIARLAALEGEHNKLVRTVLFAQPTLLDRFAEPRFESVPQPHRLELKPLDEQHTAAYIHHRLQAAGRTDGVPLGPRQVRRIHKLSGGWPGAINRLAHEALTARMEAERPRGLRRPALLLLLLGTGVALAAGGYWLQSHLASLAEFPPPETAPAPSAPPEAERAEGTGIQPIDRAPKQEGAPSSPVVLLGGERLQVVCSPSADAVAARAPRAEPPAPVSREAARPEAAAPSAGETPEAAAETPPEARAPRVEPAPPEVAPEPPVPEPEPEPEPAPKPAPPPAIAAVEPDPVTGAWAPQTLRIRGNGFTPESRVEVAWNGKRHAVPAKRTEFVGPKQLRVEVTTGAEADTWRVWVRDPETGRSEPYRLTIEAPPPPPAVEAVRPDPVPGSWEARELTVSGTGFRPGTRVEVAWNGTRHAIPGERTEFVDGQTLQVRLTPGTKADTWRLWAVDPERGASEPFRFRVTAPPKPKPEPEPEPEPKSEPEPRAAAELRGGDWVQRRPDGHFALQLLASREAAGPRQFAARHGLQGPLAAVTVQKDGRPLHLLLQGDYPSRPAAKAAVAELPAAVRRQGPWPRPFRELKPALAANGQKGLRGTDWIAGRPGSRATIQLVAARERAAVLGFLDDHALPDGRPALYRTTRDGGPWYVAVWGDFADKPAARKAVSRLPAALRRSEPWVRTFAEVQAELR